MTRAARARWMVMVVAGAGGLVAGCQVKEEMGAGGGTGGMIIVGTIDSGAGPDEAPGGTGGAGGDATIPEPDAANSGTGGAPDALLPGTDANEGDAGSAADAVAADLGVGVDTSGPSYKGRPWNDRAQDIPGSIPASWYDVGGEGIAYHDGDAANQGADQARNDPSLPESRFRANEGVDLRGTRPNDVDLGGLPVVQKELYVGWTQSGEWVNYTVNVARAGRYTIAALVATLVDGARVTISTEDGATTGPRALPTTMSYTAWDQADIATIDLHAGMHVLTVRFETPSINLLSLTFTAN